MGEKGKERKKERKKTPEINDIKTKKEKKTIGISYSINVGYC